VNIIPIAFIIQDSSGVHPVVCSGIVRDSFTASKTGYPPLQNQNV